MQTRTRLFFLVALLLAGCSKAPESDSAPSREPNAVRGRRIYVSNCTACHNVDPSRDGSIGPAVHGASETLLQTKVLTGRYPSGYLPKRKTLSMPRYSYLKPEIRNLAAYLSTGSEKPADLKENLEKQVLNQR